MKESRSTSVEAYIRSARTKLESLEADLQSSLRGLGLWLSPGLVGRLQATLVTVKMVGTLLEDLEAMVRQED